MLPNCSNPCEKKGQLVRLMIKKQPQSLGQMCRLKLMVLILLHLVKNTSRNRFQRENNNKKKRSGDFCEQNEYNLNFFSFQEKSLHNKRKKRPQEKNNYPQGDNQLSIFSSFYNAYCKITRHVTSKFVHLSRYERI